MLARLRFSTVFGAAVLGLAGCAGATVSPPPDSAAPDVVLGVYLDALVRSDCSAGRTLATSTFVFGNGELCGHTTVSAFAVDGAPAQPNPTQVSPQRSSRAAPRMGALAPGRSRGSTP